MVDTTVKDKVIRAVEKMPPDVSFEELMEQIYLLYKIDRGLKQVEAGDTMSHQEFEKRIKKWHN